MYLYKHTYIYIYTHICIYIFCGAHLARLLRRDSARHAQRPGGRAGRGGQRVAGCERGARARAAHALGRGGQRAHQRLQRRRLLIPQGVFIMSFCRSQLPHKSVNLLSITTDINDKLTNSCGNRLLQNDFINIFCETSLPSPEQSLAGYPTCRRPPSTHRDTATTPESKRRSLKVIFFLKPFVFKRGDRLLRRLLINLPPPTLWRGRLYVCHCSTQIHRQDTIARTDTVCSMVSVIGVCSCNGIQTCICEAHTGTVRSRACHCSTQRHRETQAGYHRTNRHGLFDQTDCVSLTSLSHRYL